MADGREPPPLFDEGDLNQKEDDESEDLFVSAVQLPVQESMLSNTNGHPQPVHDVEDNLLSGGGTEINLDDEDDEIYGQAVRSEDPLIATTLVTSETMSSATGVGGSSKSSTTYINKVKEEVNLDEFIEITVTDPLKIGDGMSAFMAYKVCTKTNLTFFKSKQFSVVRRFSDFLGLHDKLAEKHSHLGCIVPPAPEKSVVGMTKIKMSKENEGAGNGGGGGLGGGANATNMSSLEFVEKRRSALERFLRRTGAHPVLRVDPDFREFLEMDEELPRATNTSALSGASVLRLFNFVGDTVSKITFKMDETDPWFEEKQQQIENLDLQLRKLHNSVETLVHYRRELAQSTGVFSKSAAMLSNCEEHTTLSRALSQLAGVEDRVDQIHQQQAHNDFYILAELMKDYINLIGAIKDVFHQRVKVYQTWQHAQQMLTKKREQKAFLEVKGKTDKLSQAREEVLEWEAKVERGQEEFENISKMIRKEIDRFEYNRIKDFKETIVKYMESLMNNQQQLIKCWEGFLPEAKAIA